MTTRYTSKETAVLVRQKLAATFGKATKFSVRTDGSAINVRWDDGPTQHEVKKAVDHFRAGYFDGQSDMYEYDRESPYGNKYIFTSRHVTTPVWMEVLKKLTALYPQIDEESRIVTENGYIRLYPEGNCWGSGIDWDEKYRQSVYRYDATTHQFVHSDLLQHYREPDNWQHHPNKKED